MKKILRIYFLLLFVFSTQFTTAMFKTITQAYEYSRQLDEYPEADNDNWLNPDFTSHHKSLEPGFFNSILNRLGLRERPWTAEGFKELLDRVLDQRELAGFTDKFIQKIIPEQGDHCIIFGDLYAAFQSLMRDLMELKERGVITDMFEVQKGYYFIFNGNAINRSPYSLETLSIILLLLEKNPKNVIYLKGEQESYQKWHSYGLARELKIRAADVSDEKIPLNNLLTQFFDSLPLALYLRALSTEKDIEVVRISPVGLTDEMINEKNYADFLESRDDQEPLIFKLNQKRPSKRKVKVKALIRSEDRTVKFKRRNRGLVKLEEEEGITTWAVLSSPIESHRQLYDFFYDAFAELSIKTNVEDWTISLINRDVRETFDFHRSVEYNLISGNVISGKTAEEPSDLEGIVEHVARVEKKLDDLQKVVQEIDEDIDELQEKGVAVAAIEKEKKVEKIAKIPEKKKEEISIEKKVPKKITREKPVEFVMGSTMDLSRGVKAQGKAFKAGLMLRIDEAREQGGVNNIMPKLIIKDDGYTPKKTRKLTQEFIEDGITTMLGTLGSPTLNGIIDIVKEGKVLILFPTSGSPVFRKPIKHLVHWRASYDLEGRAITQYAVENLGVKKAVLFYQNDAFGKGLLKGAKEVLHAKGITGWPEISYERNDVNFDKQAQQIKKEKPDAIIFLAVATAAKGLIRQLGVGTLAGKELLGSTEFSEQAFKDFIAEKGLKFSHLNATPNPKTSDLEIVKQFRAAAKKKNVRQEVITLEAYIFADIALHFLSQVEGEITNDKIIQVIENTKNYDYKGMRLNLDPETREIINAVWIDTGDPDWKLIAPEKAKKIEKKAREERKEPEKRKREKQTELMFGFSGDFTKGIAWQGKAYREGLKLHFDQTRQAGGINGIIPKVTMLNDEYTPALARKNVERFLQEGITMLIAPLGSPTFEAYFDLVKEGKLTAFFPSSASLQFRKPIKNILHWRASYDYEGEALVEYAIDAFKVKKAALLYQDDAYGTALLRGARLVLKAKNITNWIEVPYERNDANLTDQAKRIKEADVDGIIFFSTANAAKSIIRQIGVDELSAKKLLGNSDLQEEVFKKFVADKGLSFIYTNPTPDPKTSELEIAKQFRDAAEKSGTFIGPFVLEAYISADLLFHFISKVKGFVTAEKIMHVAEQTKNYDYKGFKLNFNPETRTLMNTLWIFQDDAFVKKIEK